MKVPVIVQEAVTKTIFKKKKCKKVKWLSEEASHIAEKRREVKARGGKERHNIKERQISAFECRAPKNSKER